MRSNTYRGGSNDIGNVKGVDGNSMALNGQRGQGGQKPSAKGRDNPGDTKPPYCEEKAVPMPK